MRDAEAAFRVRAKVWIEGEGETLIGRGRGELLRAVRDTGSISGAARALGLSYATAWHRLHSMGEAAGQPVVEARAGGRRGGGTRLTPAGEALLAAWLLLRERVAAFQRETGAELSALLESLPSPE